LTVVENKHAAVKLAMEPIELGLDADTFRSRVYTLEDRITSCLIIADGLLPAPGAYSQTVTPCVHAVFVHRRASDFDRDELGTVALRWRRRSSRVRVIQARRRG